ncbi:L,D-transpeptidase family protein [Phenylobacterium montanum]|uniref:L,D-transpeptidase family protein n=1 Tax=Phenylobacterium montanum TaxID=2823693 RepID=A0A975IUC2_9CAUL|nr:L,D-transpeptidase family protein [Caulobacter sp. S6]QUD87648.1 L,D-transpeptidase family protein [Caulobacter sp. S6]
MTADRGDSRRKTDGPSARGLAAVLGLVVATGLLASAVTAAQPPPAAPAPQPAQAAPAPAPTPPPPPVWTAMRPDQVDLLRKTLGQAEAHGFAHDAFVPARLDALLQSQSGDERHQGEIQLIAATLRYARAVHSGRLASAAFMDPWGMRPAPFDPAPGFLAAVKGDSLAAWLEGLPPPYAGYESLKGALATYRKIAADGGWDAIDDGPDLKLGDKDPRVAELRDRLAIEDPGFAALPRPKLLNLFDQPLAEALARAQRRYGLNPTGQLGKQTLAALNRPVEDRIAQILANMERWRWLPQTLPADRIQVNIAAAVLTLFKDDQPTLSMKAVTGKPGDETPMLTSQIQSIVLNPPWNVPSDIAAKEILPKERAHPGYMKRNDFIVISTPEGGSRIQQKAGDKAALGKVKFDFANRFGVYLHDTPTKSTFSRFSRQASHGCVRLEKAQILANALLSGDAVWTPDKVQQTLDSKKTVRAPLPAPISVYLMYWTAFVGPDGIAQFRADPYDWDAALMQRIAAPAHGPA